MEIIKKPILSEKMTALTDKQNRVAFVVDKAANKFEIKKAIEKMYGVTVKEVNTMIYQGDVKSRYTKAGVISGRTASFKKAIVTLAEGDSIDFFSNI
ncbi:MULTISPECIES: 50S ribosomal protein L23 [Porphyromonadaceae]|uniref:Large ribosomal subunit protein uL23 n=1 Tax=Sanguibacteroides justesenii TaxID=1547597 RepID=A0A0C3RAY9_9PORP|nr:MULTISPECIES: 50S ribosomal protein L23 [Porphyromonadaceae]KIO42776.1 50S ribosomal protein L23 [Sanguibacteroides justesenii]KIO45104.1 50S ribosomal protein L23 [Sanguibacteroides justesenii]MCR9011000.1 50S ribosomal protein L23 [Gabonibacter chumensis]PXZ44093.1 50S ribosomal protein L23 [Sanguibacteroides justesenii]